MNKSVRERELRQFKVLIWLGAVIYSVWLFYGIWAGNYEGPTVVGFVLVWVIWYIRYIKSKAEKDIENNKTRVDWYSLPVEKYLNFSVLAISLVIMMLLCVSLLLVWCNE
jgi:hypothetical protein